MKVILKKYSRDQGLYISKWAKNWYENILHKHLMSFSGEFWSFRYTYSAHTRSRESSWKEYLPLFTHSISYLQDYKDNSLQGQELNAMTEGQDADVGSMYSFLFQRMNLIFLISCKQTLG